MAKSTTIYLDGERLYAVAQFAATTQDIEAIACIEVRPCDAGGVTLCGLNEHQCGIAHCPDAAQPPVPIMLKIGKCHGTQDSIKHLKPAGKTRGNRLCLEIDSKTGAEFVRSSVVCGETHIYISPVEIVTTKYVFPNWRAFMAKPRANLPAHRLMYPADGFTVYHTAFPALADIRGMVLHPTSEEGPTYVRRTGAPWFVGVIMPMKYVDMDERDRQDRDHADDSRPEWLGVDVPAPSSVLTNEAFYLGWDIIRAHYDDYRDGGPLRTLIDDLSRVLDGRMRLDAEERHSLAAQLDVAAHEEGLPAYFNVTPEPKED
ncbi:hypothetical protein [Oceanidesulfovibrio marinus]|uniref:Uncharacterized protein n=1 Tax=Oceanidesulfovibrio marinus TaxID=370038 RepID=A0A6P1ZB99_9BACT|nr:hypothetical protein [Oceanidesulfovibrio marinus]TVM31185.1 hypothetical protein DQK91_18925 [Oceanidesulfovibrio marinus]